jgi:membrane AbrB-like protein
MSTSLQVKYTEIKENWRQLIRSLVIGLVGSLIFVYLNLPLPWVIGALFTTTAACMLGQKLWIPDWLRANSHIVLGALFGTSVSPEFFGNFLSWFPSMLAVTAYVVLVMPPIMFYLVKVVRLDIVTAYFSAAPGGLIPMTALGQAMGADAKSISLIQSSRIILTVLLIPFLFTLFGGYEPSGRIGTGGSFLALSIFDGLFLLGISVSGYVIARPLKIPTPSLMGPMIAVAAISMTGTSSAEVPDSLVAIAQWIIGSTIGSMFNNVQPRKVAQVLFHGSLTSTFMIAFATVSALATHYFTNLPTNALVLAFAPGGFTEMALVGFALGIDIAFLVTHQLTRYFFVLTMIPLVIKILKRPNRS